jgi:hypothetical protein
MSIEDEIRMGAEIARHQMEREQRQAAEQARLAAERAERAQSLWVYLERYRDAARCKYSPQEIRCIKRRLFRRENKDIYRLAWRISSQYRGVDDIGNKIIYRLWLDDATNDLWWQSYGDAARIITLGEVNPHLSADENQALEQAEKDLPGDLGALAERNGIQILPGANDLSGRAP